MYNDMITTNPEHTDFDFSNPVIAVTMILTVGICYCVTVAVNAKYNRNTELTYKDFCLKSSSAPVTAVVPA